MSEIEQGAYELIVARLETLGTELKQKADSLNERRLELFGGQAIEVIGNERVRTANNCVPRDVVAVGDRLLFAYNVFVGLRSEMALEDVFNMHALGTAADSTPTLEALAADHDQNLLIDPRLQQDFAELYRYFKDARLQSLRLVTGKLLAIFQTGESRADTRVFRWSVSPEGQASYQDNRGERDNVYPPSHDFEWQETSREDQIDGTHPHVSIQDIVFVETVGGDLTVKIENNTESGEGIYTEPVEDPRQAIDDARIEYARLGSLMLIRVLPYNESDWRYLVFNTLTKDCVRIDDIGQSCVQLPEDHGIVFPTGYYLQRGETRRFDADVAGMEFDRIVRSPNGEDVLYVFHRWADGLYMLLPYNMIRKEVATPLQCHGYCLFDDGRMILFKQATEEPTRVHPMQIWQTPFTSDEFAAQAPSSGTFLEKVGNPDLVRGVSDCLSVRRMIVNQAPSLALYEELIRSTQRALDAYHWLNHADVGALSGTLERVRDTAELVVDEFEKVQQLQAQAIEAVGKTDAELTALFTGLRPDFWKRIDDFVEALSELRKGRGRLISLREMRYADLARIAVLEERAVTEFDRVSARAVEFLGGDAALQPYHERIASLEERIEEVGKVADVTPLTETLDTISAGLDLLTEVVGGLKIDDATVRTRILEGISAVMGSLNRVRALIVARRQELASAEGQAEFGAQFGLFTQSVQSALALSGTAEKCEEQLSRMMLALEELEARFSEFDNYLADLATKREEVYEAFESKRQMLLDQRQRRANNLMQAADRILTGLGRRSAMFQEQDDLNAFFASDPMVMKVRDLSGRLRELGDSVKSDEVDSRLKSAREDAVRGLRDKQDIFEDGASVIRLGKHRFSVNTQALDLTLVPRGVGMELHLTGTGFYEPLDDPEFEATRPFWSQSLVSETDQVGRAEYLAYVALERWERGQLNLDGELLDVVRALTADRYDEGYERGVHDVDAAAILTRALQLYRSAGLLRFGAGPRTAAGLTWAFWESPDRAGLERRAQSLTRLRGAFERADAIGVLQRELAVVIGDFYGEHRLELRPDDAQIAGQYLFEELGRGGPEGVLFSTAGEASALVEGLRSTLVQRGEADAFEKDLASLGSDLRSRWSLARAWLAAMGGPEHVLDEATGIVLTEGRLEREISSALPGVAVEGLLSQHSRIEARTLSLRLDEFLARVGGFARERVPAYRAYQATRSEMLERQRDRLRLTEYMPRVLSSFVRNKLINDVYLPIFGDNLAKQLGALGEGKRTDLMGLLLLISPPGYGKTTLMEYIASRLGLVFMKINGPALGHGVKSLDPQEAPNATARQEVDKINLALEMGNNVLLYLDDIQHTHPELLQKFISLCDAQRRIEGVWKGRTRTYDLRGKKFVVCMAGNPYTEAGEKFQIPDMLSNRADVYNLGDILGGKDSDFALSYIENSLTSNTVLAQVTTHDHKDIYKLVAMAQGEEVAISDLSYGYSRGQVDEIVSVLQKMLRVQQVLLMVNQDYIRSASMDDDYRTEPRFQLQGSYRNMNKLAEKVVPIMNAEELEQLIDDHYLGEAQTLTTGAEWNLLRLREMREVLTPDETARIGAIREEFGRRKMMAGAEDDPAAMVTGQLIRVHEKLAHISAAITTASAQLGQGSGEVDNDSADSVMVPYLDKLQANLEALHGAVELLSQVAPPTVEVMTPPPTETIALLEKQMRILEQSLKPVMGAMAQSLNSDTAVWKGLERLVTHLDGMEARPAPRAVAVPREAVPRKAAPAPAPRRAEPVADEPPDSNMACPKCPGQLHPVTTPNGQVVDLCMECRGAWFDSGETAAYLQVADDLPELEKALGSAQPTEFSCPRCQSMLLEVQFHRGADVKLDYCQACGGLWFDRGEVSTVEKVVRRLQGAGSGLVKSLQSVPGRVPGSKKQDD